MFQYEQNDKEKVELFLACRRLTNKDFLSKSDPFIKISLANQGSKFAPVGQTEMIKDNLNPNFSKTITVDYIFEIKQSIRFEVYDYDGPSTAEFIGAVESTVGAIVGAKNQTLILDLKDRSSKSAGKIIIRAEKVGNCRENLIWQWCGVKLMNTDGWFSKSDPLLRFFKRRESEWLKVYETEAVMNNLNPIWKTFKIRGEKLYSGDRLRPIRVECWDWQKSGDFQYIGEVEFNIEDVVKGKRTFDLTNPKKKKSTGTLKINTFGIEERPEFIDYIRGGEQLSVSVAIDFTGSNGIPSHPASLHAMKMDGSMNEYQKAIHSVCEILLNYDHDKKVPVYGFGGKPHFPTLNSPKTLHCFPCTGNVNAQEVYELQGIMDSYKYALQHVELSGPTLFNPLIQEALQVAQFNKQNGIGIYSILLILTDGEIHDMRETIETVVNAAALPLSIIIVGVGSSDFGAMETLDGDEGLYNSAGQKASRDLVQFVPFRKFNGSQSVLSQHVLAEIPDQLVTYMSLVGRKPNPPNIVDINLMMPPISAENQPHLMNAGMALLQNGLLGPMIQSVNANMQPTNPTGYPDQQNDYPIPRNSYESTQPSSIPGRLSNSVQLNLNFDELQQTHQNANYPDFQNQLQQPNYQNPYGQQGYPQQQQQQQQQQQGYPQQQQFNLQQGPFVAFNEFTQNHVNKM